ncbi:hypothetical protein H0H92_014139 [Tricholoma furcatifolium]|nr:hypothetical protein H0H92_014139 [Tricholoma furcatifolium]
MLKTSVDQKIELVRQLGTVLQGEVKPMITQCCIHELYLQGKLQQPSVDLAKTFERRKCNHREPIPGEDCLTSVVGPTNKHRYVIATQSQPLRVKLRNIPAVPIVHINRTVMVLEPPSDLTIETKANMEEKALHATQSDMALVGPSSVDPSPKKKKKGPKGPNPLSMKKKNPIVLSKERQAKDSSTTLSGVKRKRDKMPDSEDPPSGAEDVAPRKKRRRRKKPDVELQANDESSTAVA